MREILLATTNRGKLVELGQLLGSESGVRLRSLLDFPHIAAPEESGATFEDNAALKALYYAEQTGLATVADDSGLVVDALNGRPGIHSARYAPSDAERIEKLLEEMRDVPEPARTARFICAAAFAVPGPPARVVALERGQLDGRIAHVARGTNGFGFDPVFFVPELGCHLAEVATEVKNRVSHRARAFSALAVAIRQWCARPSPR